MNRARHAGDRSTLDRCFFRSVAPFVKMRLSRRSTFEQAFKTASLVCFNDGGDAASARST
jgi:hypothetical protein